MQRLPRTSHSESMIHTFYSLSGGDPFTLTIGGGSTGTGGSGKYSKTCLKESLKRRPKIGFKTDNHIMQIESIEECSG